MSGMGISHLSESGLKPGTVPSPQVVCLGQSQQMIDPMRTVQAEQQPPQQPNQSPKIQQDEQALQQLMQTFKNPTGPENQQQIIQIFKSNPQLMTFIKQKHQNQYPGGGVNQQPDGHLPHMINQQQQQNPQQQLQQVVLQSGGRGPGQVVYLHISPSPPPNRM